jgi:signal peptidase I
MPYLPVLLLAVLAVVNLFVVAFLLWLACKICRVQRPSTTTDAPSPIGIRYRRALGVIVVLSLCGTLAAVGLWQVTPRQGQVDLGWSIAPLAIHVFLLVGVIRLLVCPTLGRTILVALLFEIFSVLYTVGFVFVVSATILHPYVMPTGGMAETVFGYHKDINCPACGHQFAINCSREVEPSERERPMPTFACVCPNCRHHIHFPSAPVGAEVEHPDSLRIADPGIQSGDRFLAGRGLLGPEVIATQRFDLYTFQYPFSRTTMIYLKRLIGLPGETIAIHGGDLYVLSAEKSVKHKEADAQQEPKESFEAKALTHPDDPDVLRLFEQGQFEILRKSPEQILALRQFVYDNDHPGKDRPPRWKGEDGWKADGNQFRSSATKGTTWLRYRHLLPEEGDKPSLITDFTGYNAYQNRMHSPYLGNNWVGDLILECEVIVDNPQGELSLELSRGEDRFQVLWVLNTGSCYLVRKNQDGEDILDGRATALRKKGSYRLRFANVDQRLVVWLNGELLFGDGVPYPPAKRAGPHAKNDLEPASIGVRNAAVEVRKLRLFRDVYYTGGESPSEPDVPSVTWTDPDTWSELGKPPIRTFYVQPGHYFMLGDNSPESSDSRFWGSVPQRLLLGRAFFVYYPWKRVGPLH